MQTHFVSVVQLGSCVHVYRNFIAVPVFSLEGQWQSSPSFSFIHSGYKQLKRRELNACLCHYFDEIISKSSMYTVKRITMHEH